MRVDWEKLVGQEVMVQFKGDFELMMVAVNKEGKLGHCPISPRDRNFSPAFAAAVGGTVKKVEDGYAILYKNIVGGSILARIDPELVAIVSTSDNAIVDKEPSELACKE